MKDSVFRDRRLDADADKPLIKGPGKAVCLNKFPFFAHIKKESRAEAGSAAYL